MQIEDELQKYYYREMNESSVMPLGIVYVWNKHPSTQPFIANGSRTFTTGSYYAIMPPQ